MTEPAVSIVVCTRNRRERLERCIESLLAVRTEHVWQLIVVDNASTDATFSYLRLLEQRQKEVEQLTAQRDDLRNRVALLDPRHADPDLAGELLRSNLNVVHPDEMVMLLK